MNSLSELNNYANTSVNFQDDRPFAFESTSSTPATISASEGTLFNTVPGIAVTKMQSVATPLTYTITLPSALAMTHITRNRALWGTLPAGCTASEVIDWDTMTGHYTVSGIASKSVWEIVKAPLIEMGPEFSGAYSYTSELKLGTTVLASWTNNVTVASTPEFTATTSQVYDQDAPAAITGGPTLINVGETSFDLALLYVCTITGTAGFVKTISSSSPLASQPNTTLIGGTIFTFDDATKTATIRGNKSTINTILASLTLTPEYLYASPGTLTYDFYYWNSGETHATTQNWTVGVTHGSIGNDSVARSFTIHQGTNLFPTSVPYISENLGRTYTVNIKLLTAGGGVISRGTSLTTFLGWTQATQTYTFTGTEAQCNTFFSSAIFYSGLAVDYNLRASIDVWSGATHVSYSEFDINYVGVPYVAISGGTSDVTYLIDVPMNGTTLGVFTLLPHYSQAYTVIFEVPNVTCSFTKSGWTQRTGIIYKNVSNPLTFGEHTTNFNFTSLSLTPGTGNYDSVMLLKQKFVTGGTFNGTTISAGATIVEKQKMIILRSTLGFDFPRSMFYTSTQNITFGGFSITDVTIPDTSIYSFSITESTGAGVFWKNGVVQSGNSMSISGTKAFINAELAKITLYKWVSNTGSTSNLSFYTTLARTSLVFYSFVSVWLTEAAYAPANIGDYWNNGYFAGYYNGYYYVTSHPQSSVNNQNLPSWNCPNYGNGVLPNFMDFWDDTLSDPSDAMSRIHPTTTNSLTDGAANSSDTTLKTYGDVSRNMYNYLATATINGSTGWFVPSITEWTTLMTAINAVPGKGMLLSNYDCFTSSMDNAGIYRVFTDTWIAAGGSPISTSKYLWSDTIFRNPQAGRVLLAMYVRKIAAY
jgi:hypothetical protein